MPEHPSSGFVPRPFQQRIIDAAVAHFADHRRGLLVSACGTGKTVMKILIAERLGAKRILVTVPTLNLLRQTLERWRAHYRDRATYAVVCGDTGVAEDLSPEEIGLPPTTAPSDLATFLSREEKRMQIVVSTYQSSPIIAEAMRFGAQPFDLIAADEAHRTAGQGESPFRTILFDEKIPSRWRLFVTATPRLVEPRVRRGRSIWIPDHAGDVDEIASMDDLELYGPIIAEVTLAEAIRQRVLADYRLSPFIIDKAELEGMIGGPQSPLADLPMREAAAMVALLSAIEQHGLRHVITYHRRVELARQFARVLQQLCAQGHVSTPIETATIDGSMTVAECNAVLEHFQEKRDGVVKVLTSCAKINEGTDLKHVDGVLIVEPTESIVENVQRVGRALRLEPDRPDKVATVLFPVVQDDEGSTERLLRLLWSLRTADARAVQRVRALGPRLSEEKPEDNTAARRAIAAAEYEERAARVRHAISLVQTKTIELLRNLGPAVTRPYRHVYWSEARGQYRAFIEIRRADGHTETLIEDLFDDPEEAARAVDKVILEHGLNWPLNAGLNPFADTGSSEEILGVSPDYVGVYYCGDRDQWRADFPMRIDGRTVRIRRHYDNAETAARVRDALAAKYGGRRTLNFPEEEPDCRTLLNPSAAHKLWPGIEWDDVTGTWWAWVDTGDRVVSLGLYEMAWEAGLIAERVREAIRHASDSCASPSRNLSLDVRATVERVRAEIGLSEAPKEIWRPRSACRRARALNRRA